jgi:hypothetical protein
MFPLLRKDQLLVPYVILGVFYAACWFYRNSCTRVQRVFTVVCRHSAAHDTRLACALRLTIDINPNPINRCVAMRR